MDATYCKAHPRACSGAFHTAGLGRPIDRTKGGQNSKLHGICDGKMRIFGIHLTEGTASDYAGVEPLLELVPKWVKRLAADRGYDANWVREALESMGIEPYIPGKKNWVVAIEHDAEFYKERNKIERAFNRIKTGAGWRHAMTDARRCFYPLVLSRQSSCSGCNLMNPGHKQMKGNKENCAIVNSPMDSILVEIFPRLLVFHGKIVYNSPAD